MDDYLWGWIIFVWMLMASPAFSHRGDEFISESQTVLAHVKQGNALDMLRLKAWVETEIEPVISFEDAKQMAIEALDAEIQRIHRLKPYLGNPTHYLPKYQLDILAGAKDGLLQRAKQYIHHLSSWNELWKPAELMDPVFTVKKTALITFVRAVAHKPLSLCEKELFIAYPYDFPLSEDVTSIIEGSLFIEALGNHRIRIFMPNNGYVFGGTFFEGPKALRQCRGVDCSSFMSKVSSCAARYTTWDFAQIGKYLRGSISSDELTSAQRLGVLHFEWAGTDPTLLQKGDLIVWRTKDDTHGHAAIFEKLEGTADVLVYEAVRGPKVEGIVNRKIAFLKPDMDVMILRRRG